MVRAIESSAFEARRYLALGNIVVGILVVAAFAGCASRHNDIRRSGPERFALNRSDSVYVAVPKDAVYRGATCPGSGVETSAALLWLFKTRGMKAEKAASYESWEEAKQSARDKQYTYLFFPTILRWEDRHSEWVGRDQIEIEIEIVETRTGRVLDSTIVKRTNSLVGSGIDRPQALLSSLFSDYVHGLFDVR